MQNNNYDNSSTESVTPSGDNYIDIVRNFSTLSFDENESVTIIRTTPADLKHLAFYDENLSTLKKQEDYFSASGFLCTVSKI